MLGASSNLPAPFVSLADPLPIPPELGPMGSASDWLIWQLADSAFPTGGFAHSQGLEASWQHGEIRHRADLRHWLETSLQQITWAALPFLNTAHHYPHRLLELDQLCDAFLSNHVANRSSRLQGRAFKAAALRILKTAPPMDATDAPCHLAPLYGALCRAWEISHPIAARLFIFIHLRGVIAAAVRLNIVGPMEAQSIQLDLAQRAEKASQEGQHFTLDDLAQTAPLLDLWQGAHDRLQSRLFQT